MFTAFLARALSSHARALAAVVLLTAAAVETNREPAAAEWAARHVAAPVDPTAGLDRDYAALAPYLPARGVVGYLPGPDWPSEEEVRRYYVAEFALTPRVLVISTQPEFVIARVPGGDRLAEHRPVDPTLEPRLAGFTLFHASPGGVHVYRKLE